MVAKLPTYIYICSLKVTHGGKKLPTFIFGINICSLKKWNTTNEKEHIAHHIKHFEVSPKKQGKLRTKFVRSFQKHWKTIRSSFASSSKFRMVICFNFNYFSKFYAQNLGFS